MLNKCIVGYGIINGIINAVIFYLMHLSEPELLFSEADIFHDFALTGVLLGILLFVIVVPLTRMDLRKGVFSGPNVANLGGAASLVPASYAPALLVATVATTVSLMGVGAFACVLLPLPLTVTGLMLLKGLVCLRRCRRRVHHDLLRRALRQKRGLSGGLQSPGALLGAGGDRQSTANRRSWETRDAPRLFFVSWSR
ncbi:MAG: hypothetical protein ACLSGS_06540 [Adlercreutzia sp.]